MQDNNSANVELPRIMIWPNTVGRSAEYSVQKHACPARKEDLTHIATCLRRCGAYLHAVHVCFYCDYQ